MVLVAFRLIDKDKEAGDWLAGFIYRLGGDWSIKNKPFDKTRLSLNLPSDLYLLEISPSFPRFSAWLFLIAGLGVFFKWWVGLVFILCGLGIFLDLFWWPKTYYYLVKWGLKKAKSKAKVTYVMQDEALRVVVFGSS